MKNRIGLILGPIIIICILIGTVVACYADGPTVQDQIILLNQKIESLEKRVSNLETYSGMVRKGNYTLIASLTGSSSVSTDYFYIGRADIRLNWTWKSDLSGARGVFMFYLYKESSSSYVAGYADLGSNGTTYLHGLWADQYYITTSTANLKRWDITVEVWVPQ